MTINWFYTVYPRVVDGLLIFVALIAIFFLAVLVSFFVERDSQKMTRLTVVTMFAFLSSTLFWSVLDHFKKKTIAEEVFELVNSSSTKVFINGCVADKEWLVMALENISFIKLHSGSSPAESYRVVLKDDRTELELKLARDSRQKDMFWVSLPRIEGGSPGEFYLITELGGWTSVSCKEKMIQIEVERARDLLGASDGGKTLSMSGTNTH